MLELFEHCNVVKYIAYRSDNNRIKIYIHMSIIRHQWVLKLKYENSVKIYIPNKQKYFPHAINMKVFT